MKGTGTTIKRKMRITGGSPDRELGAMTSWSSLLQYLHSLPGGKGALTQAERVFRLKDKGPAGKTKGGESIADG